MIEIRLYPKTAEEVRLTARFLHALSEQLGGGVAAGATTEPGAAEAEVAAAAPATEAPGSPDWKADESAAGEDGAIPFPPFDAPPPPSPQEVLAVLQDYARTAGAAALKDLLDRFGARRVSDIKPKDYAEVLTIARGAPA